MKRTNYIGEEFVYEDNVLQFIQHEEGGIVPGETGGWEYQYNIKDHLGNTRVTFTTQPKTRQYDATMETAFATEEEALFDNLDTRHNDDALDHTDAGSTYTYSSFLTGTGTAIVGPAITLSVMAGDELDISAYGKFEDAGTYSTAVAGGFAGELAAALDATNVVIESGSVATGFINSALTAMGSYGGSDTDRPRAFLNYILFDQNFNYLSSGFDRIDVTAGFVAGNPGSVSHDQMSLLDVSISESGYAFIWISNETANSKVWFDDLQIIQTESPIIQTDDYYPFGLSMGSSYQRVDALRNRYLFNGGSELQNDMNLGLYQTLFRMYDPALGRFTSVDLLADFFPGINPYSFGLDNPISFGDPDGLGPWEWLKRLIRGFVGDGASRQAKRSQRKNKAKGQTRGERGGKNKSSDEGKSDKSNEPTESRPNYSDLTELQKVGELNFGEFPRKAIDIAPVPLSPTSAQQLEPDQTGFTFETGQPLRFAHQFHGGNITFTNPKKTRVDLYKVANYLKHERNLIVIIKSSTNLSWFKEGIKSEVGGTLGGLLKLRARAVKDALLDLGVDPNQIMIDENPDYEKGHDFTLTVKKKNE
jgi:RHS repeat-associated protein